MSLPTNSTQRIGVSLMNLHTNPHITNNVITKLLQAYEPHLNSAWYVAFDNLDYDATFMNKLWNCSPSFKSSMVVAVPNAEQKYVLP